MKKSQIRCIVGNSLVHIASILILCFFALNLIEGGGKNSIYYGVTHMAQSTGSNIVYYIVANAFYVLVLTLAIVMLIESALGLFGGIFDVKGLNMTMANRILSMVAMIAALMGLVFIIVYISLVGVAGASAGAGPITVFISSIVAVVGAFVAQTRKFSRNQNITEGN